MPRINPDWVNGVKDVVNASPYFQLQSMEIKDLSLGAARLEVDLAKKHLQPFGMVHGGVYASLIDAAGFWACHTFLEDGMGLTTVEIKLNFLAPCQGGRLIGLGSCVKQGRTLGLGDARVEDQDGRLLAHGTATVMALKDRLLEGQKSLPPKFID